MSSTAWQRQSRTNAGNMLGELALSPPVRCRAGKAASVERLLHLRMNDGHTVLAQRFCEKFLDPRRIHPGIERHVRNGVAESMRGMKT